MVLKDKIAATVGGLAIIGASLLPQLVSDEVTVTNKSGISNWPQTGLLDRDENGEPDLAIDYLVGLGPAPMYLNSREPTQAEIDWYMSQSD